MINEKCWGSYCSVKRRKGIPAKGATPINGKKVQRLYGMTSEKLTADFWFLVLHVESLKSSLLSSQQEKS